MNMGKMKGKDRKPNIRVELIKGIRMKKKIKEQKKLKDKKTLEKINKEKKTKVSIKDHLNITKKKTLQLYVKRNLVRKNYRRK